MKTIFTAASGATPRHRCLARSAWLRCVALALGGLASACGDGARPAAPSPNSETGPLLFSPPLESFALFATNSASLQARVHVTGGHVGVQRASPEPHLVSGFELALDNDAVVDASFNLYADSLELGPRATAGDLYTNALTDLGATHARVNPFFALTTLPAPPAVTSGTTALTVAQGQRVTLSAGRYADATVMGTLSISGGPLELASLALGNDARIEFRAPAQILVSGRVALADRAYVGPASDVTLSARDALLFAGGANSGGGAPTAQPAAIALGNDDTLRALVFAPNGTFRSGQRLSLAGAVLARDALIELDSRLNFEGGFACNVAACDDGNPCTLDRCVANACAHSSLDAGAACDDANLCNGRETCDGSGRCAPGAPPQTDDQNPCTLDSCDPLLGVVHTPQVAADCSDGNPCNGAESCDAQGECQGGVPPSSDDANPCTADSCDPALGVLHTPLALGTSCADADPCNGEEACDGAGRCLAIPPEPLPDGCSGGPPSTRCGDGIRDPVKEECDDGPGTDEDSCTPDCRVHDLFVRPVFAPGGPRSRSRSLGNGVHPVASGTSASAVAFVELTGSTWSLQSALFDAQGRRTGLVDVGAGASPSETADPVVVALPEGAFAIAWNDLAAGSLDVGLRRLDTGPTPVLGALGNANLTLAGAQQDPDAVWTGNELVLAWTDGFGVSSRRFTASLAPLSDEVSLGLSSELSGRVTLARVEHGWAASWRIIQSSDGRQAIRAALGSTSWLIGPFEPGAGLERSALVELDASHLLLVFSEGTDPAGSGTPNVSRLRGALLDTATPGSAQVFAIEPRLPPYAGDASIAQSRPTLARVKSRVFLGWQTQGIVGDALAAEIWVAELGWDAGTSTLSLGDEQPVEVDAPRIGDQFAPVFASSALAPEGALLTVWEEHDVAALHETLPDIWFGLRPAPFVRLPQGGQ